MSSETVAGPTTPDGKRLLERPLGVVAVLSVCVLFIAAMKWRTYHEPVRGDQGVYAVIGHELLNGRRLYSDLWDHKPPAIHVTYAAAELITGYGPRQLYLLNLAALTVTLLGLYRAGTMLAGPRAGLGAALLWAVGSIFPYWEGYQPNTEVFVNALLVWSFYFFCRLGGTPSWRWACAFGTAVGVATLFKQVAVAPAGLLVVVYLLGPARKGSGLWPALRHALVAAAAGAAVWVACAAWFWGRGNFADFYDAVFVYNRYYSGNVAQNLADSFRRGHKAYLLAVVIPCLLLPRFAGPRLGLAQRNGWLGLAGWAVGTHVGLALPGRWQEYYFELWMPVYALAGGALIAALSLKLVEKPNVLRWALPALVFVPLATRLVLDYRNDVAPWLVCEPGSSEYWNRHAPRDTGLALGRVLAPGERLYSLGPPGHSAPLYFYTGQRPTSGIFYDFPLKTGRPFAGQLEERVVRDLDRDPPDLIVLQTDSFRAAFDRTPGAREQRLLDWVSQHYSRRALDGLSRYSFYARRGSAIERRLAEEQTP